MKAELKFLGLGDADGVKHNDAETNVCYAVEVNKHTTRKDLNFALKGFAEIFEKEGIAKALCESIDIYYPETSNRCFPELENANPEKQAYAWFSLNINQ